MMNPHHHVLLLGGYGKVAQYLTPLLLQKSWNVTSIIRSAEQVPLVQKLGAGLVGTGGGGGGGVLNVLVRSIEDVKSEAQARGLIDEVRPDYVVWSAGAGGKGGPERTFAIDRDAAIHFIHASAAAPSVTRFLMVSHLGSRRGKPAWWDDDAWAAASRVNTEVLPRYYEAKLAADEALYRASKTAGAGFVGICLRPGLLTTEPSTGRVALGKTPDGRGPTSRESVARVAAALLAREEGVRNCWLDMLDGEEPIEEAVERVVREGVDAAEGEPVYGA